MRSTSLYLYPRLDGHKARSILQTNLERDLLELRSSGSLQDTDAAPAATGGIPAPDNVLASLQAVLRELEDEFNFPAPLTQERQQEFDRICGTLLYQEMGIVPADAAEEGVWSFITLVLVPEIAAWRFPDRNPDRLLGRRRNALRRLWWRARLLGPDLTLVPEGCTALNEDDYFQIMERTSISGNRRVAKLVVENVWEIQKRSDFGAVQVTRNEIHRDVVKRILAVRSHIALASLDDDQLKGLFSTLTGESISVYRTRQESTEAPASSATRGKSLVGRLISPASWRR